MSATFTCTQARPLWGVHVLTRRGSTAHGALTPGLEYVYGSLLAARAVALLYSPLGHYGTSPNKPLKPISSPLLSVCEAAGRLVRNARNPRPDLMVREKCRRGLVRLCKEEGWLHTVLGGGHRGLVGFHSRLVLKLPIGAAPPPNPTPCTALQIPYPKGMGQGVGAKGNPFCRTRFSQTHHLSMTLLCLQQWVW